MGFATALSGLKAASTSLQVTGNNIANSQTTGFKESRAEFADVYASSIGGVSKTQPGAGVRVTEVAQQFNQGNIESTQNSLDLAVSGNGFFVVADNVNLPDPANLNAAVDPSLPTAYTRNGAFQLDSKGNVINSQGKYLLAFAPNGTTAAEGFSVGVFRPLTIDTAQGLPNTTENIAMKLNINGAASAPTVALFDPKDPLSYNNTTSITTYDTQGNAHIASTYYVKTPVANVWDAYLFLDGFGITSGGPAVPPAAAAASTVSATVNTPGAPIPMTFTASGLLSDVGVGAASIATAATVVAANKAVTDTTAALGTLLLPGTATSLPTVYTNALAVSPPTAIAVTAAADTVTAQTDTAAASAAATATAGIGYAAALATAAVTAAGTAVASTGAAVISATAIQTANLIPSASAAATAWVTAATTAATSATAYATSAALVVDAATGTTAAGLATTAAADAVLAQTALTNYNAAVTAAVTTAKQSAVAGALVAKASANTLAADAATVNTTPTATALAATAKTTAATAAASAAAYATAAAAVSDNATATTAAALAVTSAADAVLAQTAANAYDAAVNAASAGIAPATKVDFGSIDLAKINPNSSVAPMAFDIDFFGTTQFATPFSVNGLTQDGLPAGNLTGIDVDGTGVVFARYSNGGSKALGQVALARFQSNQALAKLGDTTWGQTSSSGSPIYGAGGDNNFGTIQSSALEGSNVDLSAQLVKLIIAQQAYQANSQTITTEKTLIETILRA